MKSIKKNIIKTSIFLTSFAVGLSFLNGIEKYNTYDTLEDNLTYETPQKKSVDNPLKVVEVKAEDSSTRKAPEKLTIHYYNDDGGCAGREIYIWPEDGEEDYLTPEVDDDGKHMWVTIDYSLAKYQDYLNDEKLNFIIKYTGTWAGQSEDSYIYYDKYTVTDGLMSVYVTPGIGSAVEIFADYESTQRPKIVECYFDDWYTIYCKTKDGAIPSTVRVFAFDETYYALADVNKSVKKQNYKVAEFKPTSDEFNIKLNYIMHLNCNYVVESEYSTHPGVIQSINARSEYLYNPCVGYETYNPDTGGTIKVPADSKHVKNLDRFNKFFTYSGELGMFYSKDETTFKLWAPTSAYVLLNLYDAGSSEVSSSKRSYKMYYQPGGIWTLTLTGNLAGKYYTYSVTNQGGTNEVMDPYAKGCGLDGRRAMIFDIGSTNPDGWDKIPTVWDNVEGKDISSPQDLVIYESHVRDLTSDDSWTGSSKKGSYAAYIEKGTVLKSDSSVKTGFDHLEELGVNAIQLMPVFDSDNKETDAAYNWGYNPLNYFCVEGSYSTDPSDGTVRIKELKSLVSAFANNKNNTRIIMDMVFNHVASASSHPFNKIMPKYYFRYDKNWNLMDGAGCGNEIRTESVMMRKYIVDCLTYWAKEYKIKGFRLDLMGLIDSGTLREAKDALYALDPDIYLYGEGWTSGGYHGSYTKEDGGTDTWRVYNKLQPTKTSPGRIGCFNDAGRNALKGENSIDNAWGFISQGASDVGNKADTVADMLKGIHTGVGSDPLSCVNYASCHDNYTLFDQLNWTLSEDGGVTEPSIDTVAQAMVAVQGAVLSSNGVPFIHGGEEVFRTKVQETEDKDTVKMYGKIITHNSYKSDDSTNSYKWDRKASVGSSNMKQYFEALKSLIANRKNLTKYSSPTSLKSYVNENKTLIRLINSNYELYFSGREDSSIASSTGLKFACSNLNTVSKGYTYSSSNMNLKKYMFVIFSK